MATGLQQTIERQDWLQPVDSGLQRVADITLDRKGTIARNIRNFLHGKWLRHPLHPALIELPLGAWTAASLLDAREIATGNTHLRAGTDAVIGVGLLGAVGAAVTGLNDWQHTDGSARRAGALHGLLNGAATSLYLASWLLRRRGTRQTAQVLGFLGFGLSMTAAWLGGSLVYNERIGTDHAPRTGLPEDFVAVLPENELPENQLRRVQADGVNILLVRRHDRIFALGETCAHLGGPLAEGKLEGDSVRCPWHGSSYSLQTGEVLDGPSVYPQPCFETRIREGQIEVRARCSQEPNTGQ